MSHILSQFYFQKTLIYMNIILYENSIIFTSKYESLQFH